MYLNCTNDECNYRWNYGGDEPFYATCPKCRYKIRITEEQMEGFVGEIDEDD